MMNNLYYLLLQSAVCISQLVTKLSQNAIQYFSFKTDFYLENASGTQSR